MNTNKDKTRTPIITPGEQGDIGIFGIITISGLFILLLMLVFPPH